MKAKTLFVALLALLAVFAQAATAQEEFKPITVFLIRHAEQLEQRLLDGRIGLPRHMAYIAKAGLPLPMLSYAMALVVELGVATAITWGAYSVAIVPLLRRYSVWRISAGALLVGCVPLVLTAIPQLVDQRWDLGALVWAAFAFAVLGPLVLTNVLWFTAIDRVGPSRATLVTNLQPFLAAVFAVVLLSEELTWLQIAGGLTIGAALLLARRRPAMESA